jgi:hypothetical protein
MSAASQDDRDRHEDEQFAAYMTQHFGVHVPAASEDTELDDDAKVDAYVRQHFPPGSD